MKLPSFVAFLHEFDPLGTYILNTDTDENGIARFESFYLCPNRVKELMKVARPVVASDFAHLKTLLGGSMGVVTVKDANEQPTLVALYYCQRETKVAWRFLYEQLELDFARTIELHRNDAFKGSLSAADELGLTRQSCVRHVTENVRLRYPGPFGVSLKPWVYALASACTARAVAATFAAMKAELGTHTRYADAERYLKQRHDEEFNMVALLEHAICPYGELLSNAAEQFNHSANHARRLGFLSAPLHIMFEKQAQYFFDRSQHAAKTTTQLTPAIIQKIEEDCAKAKKLEVTITGISQQAASASVAFSKTHKENVQLLDDGTILCSCYKAEAKGRACVCALALQLHIAW
jgi:hypothetical protein